MSILPRWPAVATRGRRTALALISACTLLAIMLATAVRPHGVADTPAPAGPHMPSPEAFRQASWWNTPLGGAPVDSHSTAYIEDSERSQNTQDYLKLVTGDYAGPIFKAKRTDPVYTIEPQKFGVSVRVHIPLRASPQPSTDAEMTVYDAATDQVVGLWHASFVDGTWTADGVDRYYLSSDGISERLGGRKGNIGHRGIPAALRAVQRSQVSQGAINHRLVVSWHATAAQTPEGRSAYWPMTQAEQGHQGVVPEGIVIRIKPSVDLTTRGLTPAALVVATALQDYGAVIGDNSGSGNNLKLQQNASWAGVLSTDSLKSIPWKDWVFVKGGYRPH